MHISCDAREYVHVVIACFVQDGLFVGRGHETSGLPRRAGAEPLSDTEAASKQQGKHHLRYAMLTSSSHYRNTCKAWVRRPLRDWFWRTSKTETIVGSQ